MISQTAYQIYRPMNQSSDMLRHITKVTPTESFRINIPIPEELDIPYVFNIFMMPDTEIMSNLSKYAYPPDDTTNVHYFIYMLNYQSYSDQTAMYIAECMVGANYITSLARITRGVYWTIDDSKLTIRLDTSSYRGFMLGPHTCVISYFSTSYNMTY